MGGCGGANNYANLDNMGKTGKAEDAGAAVDRAIEWAFDPDSRLHCQVALGYGQFPETPFSCRCRKARRICGSAMDVGQQSAIKA